MELVVHMQQKNEEAHQRNEVLLEKSQILIVQVIESVDSLARIAHAHENRAIAEADEWLQHNQPIPDEEILAEFGVAMADWENMASSTDS
jgi:hypothetical protein